MKPGTMFMKIMDGRQAEGSHGVQSSGRMESNVHNLVIVGLIEETMLDIDTCIKVKKTTSLQSICRIDVVHSI